MARKSIDTIIRQTTRTIRAKSEPEPSQTPVNLPKKRKGFSKKKFYRSLKSIVNLLIVIYITLALTYPLASLIFTGKSLFQDGKYLVLLQNNAELRGSGGFLGSFAIVKIENSKIKDYYFESNIYKVDNEFNGKTPFLLPDFMQEVFKEGKSLTIHNSNYQADFPSSASLIKELYELEYQDNISGVIAINASVISDLLKLTGEINVPQENISINSNNFYNILQSKIDQDYFREDTNLEINEPKSILKNAINPLFAKASKVSYFKLFSFSKKQIQEKQIQFWFDDDRQEIVHKNNIAGSVDKSGSEQFMVVNNNVGGLKSSIAMKQAISLEGSSINNLDRKIKITRTHDGGEEFYSANVANKNYTTVYLPLGSKINKITQNNKNVSLNDAIIKQENYLTSVSYWATTYPNETNITEIDYLLPSNLKLGRIYYQKQSGTEYDKVEIKFNNKIYFSKLMRHDGFAN